MSLGPLIRVSEHSKGTRYPPGSHRPPPVVQERLQCGLGLVAHHRRCLSGCKPMPALCCRRNLLWHGGWGLRQCCRVWAGQSPRHHWGGATEFTRSMQFQIWPCEGGLNTGKLVSPCRLHGRRTEQRIMEAVSLAPTLEPQNSVFPFMERHLLSCHPSGGAQGESLGASDSVCRPFKRTRGFTAVFLLTCTD